MLACLTLGEGDSYTMTRLVIFCGLVRCDLQGCVWQAAAMWPQVSRHLSPRRLCTLSGGGGSTVRLW